VIGILIDEDFNNDILDGALRRLPTLNAVRVQDVGLRGRHDREVLAWAAREQRVLFTHDRRTMETYAYERVAAGESMPGVFIVGQELSMAADIEYLILIAECSNPGEWEGQVRHLPL
jgi:hypothetical protein